MRILTETEYNRLNSMTWWRTVAEEMPSQSKREKLVWLLDTAGIDYVNDIGGETEFEDLMANDTEFVNKFATRGYGIPITKLEDNDAGGLQLAADWARQVGEQAAYWPQKQIADAIRVNGTTYDGKAFFATDHPVNPFDSALGTFTNDFTTGAGPGPLPIDSSVTLDTAVQNVSKAISHIATIPMANGVDPRMLRPKAIIVPPNLTSRAQQITNAEFIAEAASTGGGAADIRAVVSNWGLGQPVTAPELAAAFGGSDTTWYLMVEAPRTQLGALTYVNREPFRVIFNGEMTSAELSRKDELQWKIKGRNVVGYGHPYLMFRAQAT